MVDEGGGWQVNDYYPLCLVAWWTLDYIIPGEPNARWYHQTVRVFREGAD